ncbi:MAG: hypothetical protein GY841_16430 [FCB group bacterium]|nr:hypothetical protein [FCB group bacterium]
MGAVNSNVLFSIGVIGASAAKAKFAMVAGAAVLLAGKINSLVKESQQYSQALKNVTVDMTEYNKATHGMIGTMDGLQGAVKLQNTGLEITGKNLKALGVAAIKYNQSIGGGPEGATEIFNRLVKSISAGNERALVPFGIQLDETVDKFKAGTEAIEKFTNKYGDLTVSIETSHEKWYSLQNNLGTVTDQIIAQTGAMIGSTDAGTGLNKMLTEQSALYEATGGQYGALTTFLENQTRGFYGLADSIGITTGKLAGYNKMLAKNIDLAKQQEKNRKQRKATDNRMTNVAALAAQNDALEARLKAQFKKEKKEGSGIYAKTKPTGGGGLSKEERLKRRASKKDVIDMSEEEFESLYGDRGGSAIDLLGVDSNWGEQAGVDDLLGGGGYMDDVEGEQEVVRKQQTNEAKWQVELEAKQQEKELQQEHHQWLLENDKAYAQAALEQRRQQMAAYAGSMATMFGNLSSLMDTENRKAFKIGKAAAISSAVINTSLAAIKAYQSLASIPFIGPALGAAAALAAIVAGGVQIKKIKDQKFGQGGAGGSFTGGGGVGAGGGGAYSGGLGGGMPAGGQQNQTITIPLMIDGEVIHQVSVNANDNASQQGLPSFEKAS